MDKNEFARLLREAEAKLAQGAGLSREEQLILLAGMILRQATRQETGYGQT